MIRVVYIPCHLDYLQYYCTSNVCYTPSFSTSAKIHLYNA